MKLPWFSTGIFYDSVLKCYERSVRETQWDWSLILRDEEIHMRESNSWESNAEMMQGPNSLRRSECPITGRIVNEKCQWEMSAQQRWNQRMHYRRRRMHYRRTDKASYRDARTHLKTKHELKTNYVMLLKRNRGIR